MTIWSLRKPSISARFLRHFRANEMAYKLSIGLALIAIQVGWLKLPWFVAFAFTFGIYLASGGWRFVRLLYLTFPRDFRFVFEISMSSWFHYIHIVMWCQWARYFCINVVLKAGKYLCKW